MPSSVPRSPGGPPPSRHEAELIALSALAWIVASDEVRDLFLGSTGLSGEDLRARADEEEMLASVLEFLTMNDSWVLDWASQTDRRPEEAMAAHAILAGTARTHWT